MGYVLRVERKPLNKKVYNSAFRVCRCSQFLSFACPSQFFFFFFAMLQNIQTESLLMKTFYYELFVFVTCSVGLSDLH